MATGPQLGVFAEQDALEAIIRSRVQALEPPHANGVVDRARRQELCTRTARNVENSALVPRLELLMHQHATGKRAPRGYDRSRCHQHMRQAM